MAARGESLYCEACGAPIAGRPYQALVDGVEMILCVGCYLKLARSGRAKPLPRPRRQMEAGGPGGRRLRAAHQSRGPVEYEISEDYAERIREARESRGWTTAVLAQKLRISESLLRKIEQGKMKPSVDLAKRIESLLRIKLLVPADEEEEEGGAEEFYPTLGDVVVIRRDED